MVECDIKKVCFDQYLKIASAPAYMKDTATPGQVYENIKLMVDELARDFHKTVRTQPITIIVEVDVNPSRLDDFKKVIRLDADGSRNESGCYRFDVMQDPGDKYKFRLYEAYKDQGALDHHTKTAHYQEWKKFKESGGIRKIDSQKLKGVDFTY